MSASAKSLKGTLLPSTGPHVPQHPKSNLTSSKWTRVTALVLCSLLLLHPLAFDWGSRFRPTTAVANTKSASAQICPQVEPLYPTKHAELWTSLGDTFGSSAFKDRAIDWLSGAVQVPTESYDNMDPVGVDPRWDAFGPFHAYLSQNFPLVHSTLQITKVNTYGLVYTWNGSDESLKPLMLTAHQDVVPVDPSTVSEWEHPPYSGFYDGDIIWGRGSSDDKSALISILSTIESFLETQFQPTRTVLLAFGFDEESDGLNGAGKLAEYLLSTYGENAFAAVVDEGGGFGERHGTIVATAGIAEKGYLDTMIEVATPGGHSSIPPSHTSIGILSALIVEIEAHPFEVHLSRDMPIYANVQCVGAHGKDITPRVRALIEASVTDDHALRELEGIVFDDPAFAASVYKALASTSRQPPHLHQQLRRADRAARHRHPQAPRGALQFELHRLWHARFARGQGRPNARDPRAPGPVAHRPRARAHHAHRPRRGPVPHPERQHQGDVQRAPGDRRRQHRRQPRPQPRKHRHPVLLEALASHHPLQPQERGRRQGESAERHPHRERTYTRRRLRGDD